MMTTAHAATIARRVADELLQWVPTDCYIGGRWRAASDGSVFEVLDPASEEMLATVANGTTDDAVAAVDAAATAMPAWATTAPRDHAEILRKSFELMAARADDIARLIVLENGKALRDARGEASYAAEFFRWFAEEAVRNRGEVLIGPGGTNKILVTRQPIGVAALITLWNFPAAMLTRKIGPALAAGCTVVCKPASETPLTALAIAKLLEEAGVPEGVVNVVPSKRSAAFAETLLSDDRVRKLSFTGSTEVGWTLLGLAAKRVVSCSMELGGNAPFLVFDDADPERAMAGSMLAKMRNGGAACTAANRFYVQSSVATRFSSMPAEKMADLRVGPGLQDGVEVGPLINASSRDKVEELVRGALVDGAGALVGGRVPQGKGFFYPPTVLTKVTPGSKLLQTEIFGPVAPIVTFDTEYGLVSYLYTGDLARGLRVSEALESGMVGLNRGLVSDPAAPFGGVKQSGIGREGGHEGMLEYLEAKYIACSW